MIKNEKYIIHLNNNSIHIANHEKIYICKK